MPELSREAMQLLDLSPAWRLRPMYRPPQEASPRDGTMVIGLARDNESQRLWQAIAAWMTRLAFDSAVISQALMLEAPSSDRVAQDIQLKRPKRLMVFGEELLQELQRAVPDALTEVEIIGLPSLASMASMPTAAASKRGCWALLIATRSRQGSVA